MMPIIKLYYSIIFYIIVTNYLSYYLKKSTIFDSLFHCYRIYGMILFGGGGAEVTHLGHRPKKIWCIFIELH
jgi:hypothetical protein